MRVTFWANEVYIPIIELTLKQRPELRPLVSNEDMDGVTYTDLSAAGELLFAAAKVFRPRPGWPQLSEKSPEQKYGLSEVEHHRPKGWQQFVKRLCRIDCVSYVRYNNDARGGTKVKIIDSEEGIIGVCFGPPGSDLPLGVSTTASGNDQTELVAAHIRAIMKSM